MIVTSFPGSLISRNEVEMIALPGGGHCWLLQFADSELDPWQVRPPFWGAGLVQARLLVIWPPSQVFEQVVHLLQAAQLPSTAATEVIIKSKI